MNRQDVTEKIQDLKKPRDREGEKCRAGNPRVCAMKMRGRALPAPHCWAACGLPSGAAGLIARKSWRSVAAEVTRRRVWNHRRIPPPPDVGGYAASV